MYSLRNYFTILIFFFSQAGFCQNTTLVDSLKKALKATPSPEKQIPILTKIVEAETSMDSIIKYSNLLVQKGEVTSNKEILQKAYYALGVNWRKLGEYDKALENLFENAHLAEEKNQLKEMGDVYTEVGNVYSESGNNDLAAIYYDRAIKAIRKRGDTVQLGGCLYNIGDGLYEKEQFDSALAYTKEARDIFRKYNIPVNEAYATGNLGRIYLKQGELDKVEGNLKKAIAVLEQKSDYNALTDFYAAMAEYFRIKEIYPKAIAFAQKSLKAAQLKQMKLDQNEAHLLLSNLYEQTGQIDSSFQHYKMYVGLRDSITNVANVEKMANQRTAFEIARKQKEVDLLNEKRKNQKTIVISTIVALILILLLAFGLYRRNKYIGRTKRIIENEKNRSELLLLNILPQETAAELKEKGKVEAKRFDAASILFTDFKNFTHYAESLAPEELVKSVDFYFSEFDRIVEKFGLEKIKTVGDSYMCAAGVPFPAEDHAVRIVAAACEMMDFVAHARKLESLKETRFEARIGINSGPVVAGVVGSKKFAYDIWGDAVNIASRMETTAETGRINISEFTYDLVKDHYDCVFRGEIEVKNKGMMKMYYVNCPAPRD